MSLRKAPLFIALFLITACQQQEGAAPSKGHAIFSLSEQIRIGGRVANNETPQSVLLSIEDSNGKIVVQNKKLSLFTFGQGYVSASLELIEGSYKLVQFQVLNAGDTVIYASPLAGSPMAQYVANPLPINFSISKDVSTQVVPQVLAVSATDVPQNFGYASFGFEIVVPSTKQKIKEIWTNEPYAQYKTYYSYSNSELPTKAITYYFFNNIWNIMDSTVYQYNADGKLSQQMGYDVFGRVTPVISANYYFYDASGLLTKISNSDPTGGMYWDFEFFYDPNGKPLYSHQMLPQSQNFLYLHEYSVNANGDIDTVSTYTVTNIGKTLKFKNIYEYDMTSSVLTFPFRDAPLGQKHNVIAQRLITYNLVSSNGSYNLVVSYDCKYTVAYQYGSNGFPSLGSVSNPDGCTIGNGDKTQITYIYW